MNTTTRQKGNFGEELSVKELLNKGYRILERNFSSRYGEIDIIAEHDNYIIFVEVKLRKSINNGYPKEAVNKSKQRKIILTAQEYIIKKNIQNMDFRFDVIEIIEGKEILFNHIKNAFWIEE